MEQRVQAIYEDGVLRPLEPLLLQKWQEVTITISDRELTGPDSELLISSEEWATAVNDEVSLDEVHRALAPILGSLSEAVLYQRLDR